MDTPCGNAMDYKVRILFWPSRRKIGLAYQKKLQHILWYVFIPLIPIIVNVFFRAFVLSMVNTWLSLFSPYFRKFENDVLGYSFWWSPNDFELVWSKRRRRRKKSRSQRRMLVWSRRKGRRSRSQAIRRKSICSKSRRK